MRGLTSSILLFTARSRGIPVVLYEPEEEGKREALRTRGVLLPALDPGIPVAIRRLVGRRLGLA